MEKASAKPKWDDKLSALRAARRAKGLCMKCGEQYSPQHRCLRQIPLHVLEEVLETIQVEQPAETMSEDGSQSSDEELLTLSICAAEGIQGKRTIRMQGLIQNKDHK